MSIINLTGNVWRKPQESSAAHVTVIMENGRWLVDENERRRVLASLAPPPQEEHRRDYRLVRKDAGMHGGKNG